MCSEGMMFLRNLLLALHIISAGIWFAQLPLELFYRRMRKQAEGTPAELTILTTSLQVVSSMGQTGGMGILVTGLALVILEGLGFLGIGGATPTWLVIKQIISSCWRWSSPSFAAPAARWKSRWRRPKLPTALSPPKFAACPNASARFRWRITCWCWSTFCWQSGRCHNSAARSRGVAKL
jgi:hypothetical protein